MSVAKNSKNPSVIVALMVISGIQIVVLVSVILTEQTNTSAKLRMANVRANQTLPEIIVTNVLLVTTTSLLALLANVIPLARQITNVNKIRDNVRARRITLESNAMSAKMGFGIIRSVLVSAILFMF